MEKINVSDNCVLVKIYDADKKIKNTSAGGIITENMLNPLANLCGIGEAVSVGNNMRWINEGDIVLYSWIVEDQPERFLGRDDDGEYRIVKDQIIGGQIYGLLKNNKAGHSHIIPKKYYFLAEPHPKDLSEVSSMIQIPVSALNPNDDVARKMGIKVGDFVLCLPYSPKPISIKRKVFWFVFLEDVIALNRGEHRIAINRKKVYKNLRLASRNIKTELN